MGVKNFLNRFKKKKDKEDVIAKNNIMSFGPGFALTELPIISLYQDGVPFNFLLDTGSNDSIIDSNVLDKIKHTMSDKQSQLFGMEGNTQVVNICRIELSYEDAKYPYDYNIKDMSIAFGNIKAETGVTLHGIIGSKFFNAYKYVLDFDSLVAYSKR